MIGWTEKKEGCPAVEKKNTQKSEETRNSKKCRRPQKSIRVGIVKKEKPLV